MTRQRSEKPTVRETSALYRGRTLILTIYPGYVAVREKGRQKEYNVDYLTLYDLAQKLDARRQVR